MTRQLESIESFLKGTIRLPRRLLIQQGKEAYIYDYPYREGKEVLRVHTLTLPFVIPSRKKEDVKLVITSRKGFIRFLDISKGLLPVSINLGPRVDGYDFHYDKETQKMIIFWYSYYQDVKSIETCGLKVYDSQAVLLKEKEIDDGNGSERVVIGGGYIAYRTYHATTKILEISTLQEVTELEGRDPIFWKSPDGWKMLVSQSHIRGEPITYVYSLPSFQLVREIKGFKVVRIFPPSLGLIQEEVSRETKGMGTYIKTKATNLIDLLSEKLEKFSSQEMFPFNRLSLSKDKKEIESRGDNGIEELFRSRRMIKGFKLIEGDPGDLGVLLCILERRLKRELPQDLIRETLEMVV